MSEAKQEVNKSNRKHKATYAKDKLRGGYSICVKGPNANKFANREVPVTLKSGEENIELLTELQNVSEDTETGEMLAFYKFEKKETSDDAAEF